MRETVLACSVCFGDPNSLLSKGAFWGVLSLVGVVAFVLAWIAIVALAWTRKADKLTRSASSSRPES